jgi:hypothetical protein
MYFYQHKLKPTTKMREIIQAIIATYENQIGQIDPDKSLAFEIKDKAFDLELEIVFTFITHVIPMPDPERDETVWGTEKIFFTRTDGIKELARLVWDVCELVDGLKIKQETEAESW